MRPLQGQTQDAGSFEAQDELKARRYNGTERSASEGGPMGWQRLLGDDGFRGQLGAEAPLEFLAHIGDFHAGHDDELAGLHFARFVIIGKLTGDTAILAILVPAEAAVGDGLRADELKATEQGVALGDLEFSSHDYDVHELFVRTKWFRHRKALSFTNGAEKNPPER